MGIRYTKKEAKDVADERTVPAEEFVNLMIASRRLPDEVRKESRIESNK